jgi:predicted TIM-barrel fold metal-dependent hydrolase
MICREENMIIDSHAHACGRFLTGENIISELDQNNIQKLVLVPGELNSAKEYFIPNIAKRFPNKDIVRFTNIIIKFVIKATRKLKDIEPGNEYVYSLVQNYPERLIQFYWCVLSFPGVIEKLEKDYQQWRFRGLKLHQCWEKFSFRSEIFYNVAKFAEDNNLPIFIHVYSPKDVLELIEFLVQNPKIKIIIGHLFGLEEYIHSQIHFPNTYFEISTPQLVSESRLLKAINYFGPDRILFGSDVPYGQNNQRLNIERVKNLDISEVDKDKILGDNMRAILNI